ncbi:MAG: hypothetical protein ACKVOK_07965 [Flavobacteriales bacterium]
MISRITFTLSIILAIGTLAMAQDIKPLDYAPLFQREHVKKRICKEVKYQGNKAVDSTMIGIAEFDKQGRMVHYTEFFAGGRKMAEHFFRYDETGKMTGSSVSLVFNSWATLDFELKYDAKGRVISRELKEPMANFWQKETYTYSGIVLLKSEQWYDVNGGLVSQTHKDYPPTLDTHENSLTYIYNERGLLMMHQLFNKSGRSERALVYSYEYY